MAGDKLDNARTWIHFVIYRFCITIDRRWSNLPRKLQARFFFEQFWWSANDVEEENY